MKTIIKKYGSALAALALVVSGISANYCMFFFHQPKVPEAVMKLRKERL
jgi:cyclic lactone autoinducer peptide